MENKENIKPLTEAEKREKAKEILDNWANDTKPVEIKPGMVFDPVKGWIKSK